MSIYTTWKEAESKYPECSVKFEHQCKWLASVPVRLDEYIMGIFGERYDECSDLAMVSLICTPFESHPDHRRNKEGIWYNGAALWHQNVRLWTLLTMSPLVNRHQDTPNTTFYSLWPPHRRV